MATEPSWTWQLRGKSAGRWQVRWWYRFLHWCTDSSALTNRLVSVLSLGFGVWYVSKYVATTEPSPPDLVYVLAAVAVLIAIKGLIGHLTYVVFRERTIVGGTPTADRFEYLVPQDAKKVALVGQNLASRFDEKYDDTLQGLQTLLSRRGRGNTQPVEEVWLVVMTPLALLSVHPEAAVHLRSVTLPGLRRLAEDLCDERVKVAFHPAATLSMLVVDWGRETPLAVVTPKLQTLHKIDARLSVVLRGADFEAVAPHFDRFLSKARRGEFPGACTTTLPDAANRLEELFKLDVVGNVGKYIRE